MEFTTKQEYIYYRNDWKVQYNKLSITIKTLKTMLKEESRACAKARKMLPAEDSLGGWFGKYLATIKQLLDENEYYTILKTRTTESSYNIKKFQSIATDMLNSLKEAKIEAQRSYLASKQLTTV